MSLLKSIGRALGSVARAVAPVASVIPGVGQVVAAAGMLGAKHAAKQGVATPALTPLARSPVQASLNTVSLLPAMGALPPLTRALPAVGAAGTAIVRGASSAMRGAITWCRRNPQWCSTVGGTAAVAAMIESGQLPAPRRRRGRGISGRDLRAYRRVHNLLAGFCAPKARIRKSC